MRALTVQQPWAQCIAEGHKTIENRSARMAYRGPLAIHAGTRWSKRGGLDDRAQRALWGRGGLDAGAVGFLGAALPMGAVIAVAELVDCHPDQGCCRPWGESEYAEAGGRNRTAVWHLVLDEVRRLAEPVPCRGALGLWRPPAEVVEAIGREAAAG